MVVKQDFIVYFDGDSKASFCCILRDRFGPSKHLKKHCLCVCVPVYEIKLGCWYHISLMFT